jgi:hypothetical protein
LSGSNAAMDAHAAIIEARAVGNRMESGPNLAAPNRTINMGLGRAKFNLTRRAPPRMLPVP